MIKGIKSIAGILGLLISSEYCEDLYSPDFLNLLGNVESKNKIR